MTKKPRRVSRAGQPKPPPITDGLTARLNRNLRGAALAAGLRSIAEVASRTSPPMTRASLERRLSGEYRWFLDDVDRVSRALGTTTAALLGDDVAALLPREARALYASIPADGMPADLVGDDEREIITRLVALKLAAVDAEGMLRRSA